MKKQVLPTLLMATAFLSGAVARAASQADAAHLQSGALQAAHQAHPVLVTLAHIVFIIVLVSFGGVILTSFINPRTPPR